MMSKRYLVGSLIFAAFCVPLCGRADDRQWLENGLPPLIEPEKPVPFEITRVTIKRNDVDQEILTAECQRHRVVPTLAQEVRLVLLPVGGGRHAAYLNNHIVQSPFAPGSVGAILDNLLDFRGEIPGGARVYLEMKIASPVKNHPPARISSVYWMGTAEQLAAAKRGGLPPDPASNAGGLELGAVPDGTLLPAGFPVRVLFGDRWTKATLLEPAAPAAPLKVIMFLARPGKLFLPWQLDVNRKDARVETATLAELSRNPSFFANAETAWRQRLARLEAPRILESAEGKKLESGQALVMPNHGLLDWATVVAVPREGVVRVRSGFERREIDKPIGQLYLDPEPPEPTTEKPAGPPSAASSNEAAKAAAPVGPEGLVAVKPDALLKVGDRLKAEWAGKYHDVEVLELLADGRVKVRWIGWGDNWDEVRSRDKLLQPADAKVEAKPETSVASASDTAEEYPLRTWTDNTGKSKVEARFVSDEETVVVLKRKDGRQIKVPKERLSKEDRAHVESLVKSPFE